MDFGSAIGYGTAGHPSFWIGALTTGEPNREVHVAFGASERGAVRAFFEAAVAAGAEVLHEPRVWDDTTPTTTVPSSGTPTATMSRRCATRRGEPGGPQGISNTRPKERGFSM